MLKKTFKNVETFTGEKIDVVAFFSMTKAEVTKLAKYRSRLNGLAASIAEDEDNAVGIVDVIEDFIKMAYGRPSKDGLGFVKDPEEANAFIHSPMFDTLLEELLKGGAEAITKFMAQTVGGISQSELMAEYEKASKDRGPIKEIPEFTIENKEEAEANA